MEWPLVGVWDALEDGTFSVSEAEAKVFRELEEKAPAANQPPSPRTSGCEAVLPKAGFLMLKRENNEGRDVSRHLGPLDRAGGESMARWLKPSLASRAFQLKQLTGNQRPDLHLFQWHRAYVFAHLGRKTKSLFRKPSPPSTGKRGAYGTAPNWAVNGRTVNGRGQQGRSEWQSPRSGEGPFSR
jgi:hypothetical protein